MIDQDPRLGTGESAPECCVCGRSVWPSAVLNDPHWLGSKMTGGIMVAAHGACLSGLSAEEMALRYQRAVFAASLGVKERWRGDDQGFLSR